MEFLSNRRWELKCKSVHLFWMTLCVSSVDDISLSPSDFREMSRRNSTPLSRLYIRICVKYLLYAQLHMMAESERCVCRKFHVTTKDFSFQKYCQSIWRFIDRLSYFIQEENLTSLCKFIKTCNVKFYFFFHFFSTNSKRNLCEKPTDGWVHVKFCSSGPSVLVRSTKK